MMMDNGTLGFGSMHGWGMFLFWIPLWIFLILGIAALIKYLSK